MNPYDNVHCCVIACYGNSLGVGGCLQHICISVYAVLDSKMSYIICYMIVICPVLSTVRTIAFKYLTALLLCLSFKLI